MAKSKSTFIAFLDANENLVNEYEEVLGDDLWSLPAQEVEDMVRELAAKIKIGFNSILNNCINHSIETETPLMEVLEGFSSNDFEVDGNKNSIQKYFSEINKIYEDNDNDYDIPFRRENRDKIISMNLKSVIAIAKGYQGLGVDFQDLISAGNEGLCRAFEKYDPKRACLKENILEAVEKLEDEIPFEELDAVFSEFLKYGDVKKYFLKSFKEGETYKKDAVIKWVNKKINNAKFNSVACKWIRAYIINEINTNSRIVKKPKAEIDKDKEETGSYKKEQRVNIDAPIGDDNKNTIENVLVIDNDETTEDIERDENYYVFKQGLNKLLDGVKSRDRRIVLKKFGIGLVRPMLPNEIAAQEDLSVARISQIISSVIKKMGENREKFNINKEILFEALHKIYD